MNPEQSNPVDGLEPPQTYGTPRYCSAMPTTPPYFAAGNGRTDAGSTAGSYVGDAVCCAAACGGGCCAAACCALPCASLRGERGLAALLLRLHPRDLVLDGAEKPVLLGDLRLDRLLLGRLLLDDLRLLGARLLEGRAARARPPCGTASPSWRISRVLARDALDRLEPRDDVVEAARPEDHLERRVALAVDVQVAKALGDAVLRDDEALPRRLRGASRSSRGRASIWSSWTFA